MAMAKIAPARDRLLLRDNFSGIFPRPIGVGDWVRPLGRGGRRAVRRTAGAIKRYFFHGRFIDLTAAALRFGRGREQSPPYFLAQGQTI